MKEQEDWALSGAPVGHFVAVNGDMLDREYLCHWNRIHPIHSLNDARPREPFVTPWAPQRDTIEPPCVIRCSLERSRVLNPPLLGRQARRSPQTSTSAHLVDVRDGTSADIAVKITTSGDD
jgi:hypothetical protein